VKSKYMVDPDNAFNLIKREDEEGAGLDREYWERVNQGENVRGAAQKFERSVSNEEEKKQQQQPAARVGKLKHRAGFLESLQGEESPVYRDQVQTGKLKMDKLFCGDEEEEVGKAQVKVGKLNREEVGLFTGVVEAVPAIVRPTMQIGKLDPKNLFDNGSEDKENEANRRSSMVIGKLNAKNLFENNAEEKVDSYKSSIQVGKINTKDIFTESNDSKPLSKIDIKVGKLKIKEEDLFETKDCELAEKSSLKVGKLTAPDLFTGSPTEEKNESAKFYKPVVQPKKLKVAELFTPAGQESEPSPKEEIKVGRLNAESFLRQTASVPNEPTLDLCKVGKLDTSKLFAGGDGDEEEQEEKVTVGKLKLVNWEANKEESGEVKREVVKVGKLRPGVFEAKEGEEKEEKQLQEMRVGRVKSVFTKTEEEKESAPVVLRGARRVNKGNRISCLIENLHTDKKEEEEEGEGEELEKEEVALGREKMSRIQSMFSGEKKPMDEDGVLSSPSCTDFNELMDEGLVSANLHRFTSGNLRRTSQDSGSPRRTSMDTAHIDKKHIGAVASKFEESGSTKDTVEPLGKGKSMRLRGAEDIFQHSKEEYTDCVRSEVRVGKLSKDAFKPAPDSPKEERTEVKVPGKIITKDLFAQAEANSEELLREVRVGKLTQDRLTLASSTDLDSLDKSEIDTSIAPTGGVQEKASAFSTPKAKSPAKLNCPKIKRSESSLESDMQKKYQQQLASTALKRGNSTAALVVKKEGNETVLKVDKVAKNLTVDDDNITDDMQRKYQQQLASTALKRGNSSASIVVRRDPSLRKEALLKVEPVAKQAPVEDEMTVGEMLRTPVEPRVEAGKMQEARSSFFSSMIAASNSATSASVQKLGTSIVPAVSAEDREKFEKAESSKQQSKGKALFQRRKEREREEGEVEKCNEEEEERLAPVELLPGVDMDEMRMTVMMRQPAELLPGVDLEEIEDEFEELHRQMMDEAR